MGSSGKLSSDLNLEILTPAASVRRIENRLPDADAEGKARRRARPEKPRSEDDGGGPSDADDQPKHQIDQQA
jgi:hypothetical protein